MKLIKHLFTFFLIATFVLSCTEGSKLGENGEYESEYTPSESMIPIIAGLAIAAAMSGGGGGSSKAATSGTSTVRTSTTTSTSSKSCYSSISCGVGGKCVKQPGRSSGICMKVVNEFGMPDYSMPDIGDFGVRPFGSGCRFNTDCSIGFACDRTYKVCVKR